jgi:two-component system nitrogen regulation response regulator NtrX
VRELKNVAERLSVFGTDPVTLEQLPTSVVSAEGAFKAQCEKEYLEAVLRRTNWNVTKAAELLEIQRTHLHEKMTSLGIVRPA